MKEFKFTVSDPCGIHARPAGLLVDFVKQHSTSTFTVEKKSQKVNAKNLMLLMGLRVQCGDVLRLTVEGENEEKDASDLSAFLSEIL